MKKAIISALLVLAIAGCKATKTYPDPLPGSHSADYSSVFGRLQRIAPKNPDNPSIWVVRFGLGSEPYGGQFALTPPEKLIGYIGGEQVELKGTILKGTPPQPDFTGSWYQVQGVRMWSNYH